MSGALSSRAVGHLAGAGFSALIAGSFALGGLSAPFLDPALLNAIRFLLAALLLWGFALLRGDRLTGLGTGWWRYAILAGLTCLYFVTMFEGLKTAAPVSMAAVFTLTPLLSAGLGWIVLRQAAGGAVLLALATGGLGALWVIFRGDIAAFLAFELGRGEAVFLAGCVAYALYATLLRRFDRGESSIPFNAMILAVGAGLLAVWSVPFWRTTDWGALPPIVWITIAYTAVAATAASFVLIQVASLRLPAAKVMAYTYLVPSWVILWQIALGQGAPSAGALPGMALTVFALMALLVLRDRHPDDIKAP